MQVSVWKIGYFEINFLGEILECLLNYQPHYQPKFLFCYLALKLCFWTGIIFTRVYVSVCLCVRVYIDYLKKFLTDFDETWQDDL